MTAPQNPPTHEIVQLFPRQGEWTEEAYFPLTERNRIIELSDGKLVIPPMPTDNHQLIVGNIYVTLRNFVNTNKIGRVRMAPLPVRLWPGKVREPDVMVMLNEHQDRVQQQHWGPPDLVVEVLSPGTQKTDRESKLTEYAAAGIREYWIVLPETQTVELYTLADETAEGYAPAATYSVTEQIISRLLEGLVVPAADIFQE